MTCTKSCHDCIYGVPIATKKCENPNATCDGACYKCLWAIKKDIKYICTGNIAYRGVTQ